MYGATEATARMAYLPPELAASRPSTIGRPIPGGSFTIEPVDEWADDAVGELVYRGPNVMMGYAHGPADLALRQDGRHAAHRRHRPARAGRALRGRRPQQPLRQDVRPANRPAAPRVHPARARRHGVLHRRRRSPRGRRHGRTTTWADVQRVAAEAAGVPAGAVRAVDRRPSCRCCRRVSRTTRRCATLAREADAAGIRRDRPSRLVRRRAAPRPRHRRSRRQLR